MSWQPRAGWERFTQRQKPCCRKSEPMSFPRKRLPIISEEQRELRNALNRLRDKYLAMGRYSDGIDSVILKVMKPNTSRRFFW